MRRRRIYVLVAGLAAVATVALMLAFVVVPGGTEDLKSLVAVTREVAPTPGGSSEGIVVHGHWTIEVRNPDGTLTERREFENAFQLPSGQQALVGILARIYSVGGWRITLLPSGITGSAFLISSSVAGDGIIVESTYTETFPNIFKTLTVNVGSSGDENGKLVLRGTATAQTNGHIGRVRTEISMLNATQPPPGSYAALSLNTLTQTTLPSPVNLTSGQTVTVVVVISFS